MIAIPMQVAVSHVCIPTGIDVSYQMRDFPDYDGPYEFTPTMETQTVPTKEKALLNNIVINPIPQNYGLITYNGAYITVS